jgi:four helix bundle protein
MIPENTKPTNFFKFEGLRIYHKSVDFTNAILTLCNTCQTAAQKALINQFVNEAGQISSNIIDGSSLSKVEFTDCLQRAKSNIGRCVMLCTLASKQHLIDETQETDIRNELMELTKMIGALIISFQKHDSVNNPEV